MNALDTGRAVGPLLASLDICFEYADRLGAFLAALPMQSVQLPGLVLFAACIAALWRKRSPAALALHGLAALGIAAVAQMVVLDGRIFLGLGVYGVAVAADAPLHRGFRGTAARTLASERGAAMGHVVP